MMVQRDWAMFVGEGVKVAAVASREHVLSLGEVLE
jgi:hypothetical protein